MAHLCKNIGEKMRKKKLNIIIDTDPGVDDTSAIMLAMADEMVDIKLITTVCGNLDLKTVTRNALHVLEKFNRTEIPVAMGAKKAMYRVSPDARFIHQNEGLGGYIPPKTVKTKPIETSAIEAMYNCIKENKNDISIVACGPHTNLGMLIEVHPDVVDMVDHIYCEGCARYGVDGETYISFNVSTDPEAFEIVLNSGIPITIIPSRMGRELANFNEEEVYSLKDINEVGKFLFDMYSGYWEPAYPDRRIATNDSCAYLVMRYPKLFKTRRAFFTVDTDKAPGKTIIEFNRHGNVNYAYKVNRKKLHEIYFNTVRKYDNIKLK